MNSFVGGLLIGFAGGLWFAILLYWLAGKRAAYLAAHVTSAPEPTTQPAPPREEEADEAPLPAADEPPAQQEPALTVPTPAPVEAATSRYTRLVAMVGGDATAAERLIDYERTRAPDAARAILIQNAIDRLVHDRR